MTAASEPTIASPNVSGMTRPLTGSDIMEELAEEIRKQYGGRGGVKAFTDALPGVNYFTYLKHLNGKTPMSAELLVDSLEALGVEPAVFFRRLRERLASEG